MHRSNLVLAASTALALGAAAIALSEPSPQRAQPDAAPAAADPMAIIKPGPEHARLMKLAGEWAVTTTFEAPGQPKQETSSSSTLTATLGGRFLNEAGKGELMGMPTESFKSIGYNNGSKKYEAIWQWTLSTGLLHLSGASPDGGKTIQWDAWYDDEAGRRADFKVTTVITDDDHFSQRIDGGKLPDGSPGPVMTSVYTRRK